MKNYAIHTTVMICMVFTAVICPTLNAAEQKAPPVPPTAAPPAPRPATPPPPPAAKPVNPNELVVTVNGIEITEGQVDLAAVFLVRTQLRNMMPAGSQMPPGVLDQMKGQFRPQAIDKVIVEQLVEQQVTETGVVVTEQDALNHITEMGAQQKPPMPLEQIQEMFTAQGRSFDEFKKKVQQSKDLKFKKHTDALFAGKIKVTDEEIQKYYDENKQKFEHPDLAKARHILIMPEKTAPDPNAAKAEAKAKAQGLLKQIKEDKADFSELAKENSDCSSAARGGDLGFFPRQGMMVEEFSKATFALEVGQMTDIVETQFGYHIIKLDELKKAGVAPLDEVKGDIDRMLRQQQRNKLTAEYFESLKAKAKIVYAPGKEPKPMPAPMPKTAPPPPPQK